MFPASESDHAVTAASTVAREIFARVEAELNEATPEAAHRH
jgi:hypothetical protein